MVVAAGSTAHHFASCFFAVVLREVLARVLRLVARAVVRLRVLGLCVVFDMDVLILVVRVVGLAVVFRVALLGVTAVRNTSTAHSPTVGT